MMKRRSPRVSVLLAVTFCAALLVGCAARPTPTPVLPPATASGATVIGRIVLGYGDHSPVADLPLWVGKESQGQPATRTNANGEFTLTNLPIGRVIDVVDDHLTFQVDTTPGGIIDVGTLEYPLIHPPMTLVPTP